MIFKCANCGKIMPSGKERKEEYWICYSCDKQFCLKCNIEIEGDNCCLICNESMELIKVIK